MIFLAILAILIGILINCLVISFLLKYPLNPSRLAGNEGEIGRRGLIGSKVEEVELRIWKYWNTWSKR